MGTRIGIAVGLRPCRRHKSVVPPSGFPFFKTPRPSPCRLTAALVHSYGRAPSRVENRLQSTREGARPYEWTRAAVRRQGDGLGVLKNGKPDGGTTLLCRRQGRRPTAIPIRVPIDF